MGSTSRAPSRSSAAVFSGAALAGTVTLPRSAGQGDRHSLENRMRQARDALCRYRVWIYLSSRLPYLYNPLWQNQRVIDSAHEIWASLGLNTGNRGRHGVVAQNPPLDRRPTTYHAGRTKDLPGAWVPALLLLALAALYLLFDEAQHANYLFFLPVAFAGVGLGARAGILAAAISMVVVIAGYPVEGRAYLTGELSVPTIELESFIIWA